MDQIRNTIMQHEALFKEQVKALHKLYSIQKSAMQEMRTMQSRAQILAYNSESHIAPDDRYGGSIAEGNHLRPAYATSQAFKNESLALSLHPFYVLGYKGCGSLWMCKRGVETLQTAQSKQIRNFDLEKLPEEYIDEFENQSDPNTCKIADENSVSLKRTTNTSGDSQDKAYRRDIKKQILLHQGSLNFITAGYNTVHSENDPEKIPEQASGQIVEDNFPEDPVIRYQGSTTLDSMQCDSTFSTGKSVLGKQDLYSFPLTSQTSKGHDFENPNDSGNGSNSIQSQYKKKSSEDKSGGSEAVQRGYGGEQNDQAECEEVAQVIKGGFNPLLSCTLSDYKSTTFAVLEGDEHLKNRSSLLENIAAEILLSMAPSNSHVDFHLHDTRTKTEFGNFSKDNMMPDKTRSLCDYVAEGRQTIPEGAAASESIKWAKTVNT